MADEGDEPITEKRLMMSGLDVPEVKIVSSPPPTPPWLLPPPPSVEKVLRVTRTPALVLLY
ncbi:MAG: hypothetical protein ACK58T_01085, partial [Phycisphaerae bacterium]